MQTKIKTITGCSSTEITPHYKQYPKLSYYKWSFGDVNLTWIDEGVPLYIFLLFFWFNSFCISKILNTYLANTDEVFNIISHVYGNVAQYIRLAVHFLTYSLLTLPYYLGIWCCFFLICIYVQFLCVQCLYITLHQHFKYLVEFISL